MVAPLLATKLYIPPLRRSLVRRPRLLEHLDQGLRRKLTLVSAPAGFGKTTLVAEWVRDLEEGHSPEVKVAWISLDSGDDDPARFFAYLSAAVERAGAGLWQDHGETLEPAGLVAFESPLVELINRVAVWPVSILLSSMTII